MSTPRDPELMNVSGEPQESQTLATGVQSDAQAPDVSVDTPNPSEQAKREDDKRISEVDLKFLRAVRKLTSDEDHLAGNGTRISLRSILGGDILLGEWFQKQLWYLLMVVVMIIFYTSNRYACQQEALETKALNDTLLDRRYKALTRAAQLKQSTRRSYIEETLKDSTIQTSIIAPFTINVDE